MVYTFGPNLSKILPMPEIEAATESTTLCSKCGKNPRAEPNGTNPWCKECRAKYQREYQETKKEMAKGKGFAAGVAAMKECLAEEFDRLGSGMFSGYEVGYLIRQAPGPAMPAD